MGSKIVQGYERHDSNGDRSYVWTGVTALPLAIKTITREAITQLPGQNFIAWDLILDPEGVPYLFEGNTCPGIGATTVGRVLAEMNGEHYARVSN